MKTIKIFISAILLISIFGCEKYLDIVPKTQLAPQNLYETEKGIILGVKGIYLTLREATSVATYEDWLLTEVSGDDMLCHSDKSERQNLDKYLVNSENIVLLAQWQRYYKIIAFANSFIDNVNISPVDNQDLKNKVIGEARFIRGYAYFMLVRLWGDVPLIVSETKSDNDFFVSRAPKNKVYDQIKEDFNFAETNLPLSYQDSEDFGRATRGAAKAFYSKVYLTLGDFANASSKAAEVMTLGYSLLPDYSKVFSLEGNSSIESIFEVQALSNVDGMGSAMGRYWSPKKNILGHKGSDQYTVSNKLYAIFETNDLRKKTLMLAKNSIANNASLPYSTKYLDPTAGSEKLYGTNFQIVRYAEILLTYAEAENEVNGPTASAYNAINKVRNRAGLSGLTEGFTKVAFRDAVYTERRKELYFEGVRWFDLIRTGTLKQFVESTPAGATANYFPLVELPKHLLFPIPANEIQANPNLLPNNPGY